jgi:hypothetical protein
VCRKHARRFPAAIGSDDPRCLDVDAARRVTCRDVVEGPTFLARLDRRLAADGPVFQPGFGPDFSRVVRGERRYLLHRSVWTGDVQHPEEVTDADPQGWPDAATLGSTTASRSAAQPQGAQ